MTYKVEITTAKATFFWVNGGLGYTEQELTEVTKKLNADNRVLKYTVVRMGRR